METIDTAARELIRNRGKEAATAVIAAHRGAIGAIEAIVREHRIECEFLRVPAYRYASSAAESAELREEAKALRDIGVQCAFRDDGAMPFGNEGYLAVERQAKLHPLKFLYRLAAILAERDVTLFEKSEVRKIEEAVDGGVTLLTDEGVLRARHVLVATHYPKPRQPARLFFNKARYVTYALEARIPHGALPEALYEDMANPYHYARVDRGADHYRYIVGGEDHRADIHLDPEKNFTALIEYMARTLGTIPHSVVRRWRGPIIESGDGLAFIGPVKNDGRFYATGHSGNGLTYAAIAAASFRGHVLGNRAPGPFDAGRPIRMRTYLPSALDYLSRFFGGAFKNAFKE